jgi:hypothetical protein
MTPGVSSLHRIHMVKEGNWRICLLMCFLNFHRLLGNRWGGSKGWGVGGVELVSLGTHKCISYQTGDIICDHISLFPSLKVLSNEN